MLFPFDFSSTAGVGAKTSVWADEIKRDFTFGSAFFLLRHWKPGTNIIFWWRS